MARLITALLQAHSATNSVKMYKQWPRKIPFKNKILRGLGEGKIKWLVMHVD